MIMKDDDLAHQLIITLMGSINKMKYKLVVSFILYGSLIKFAKPAKADQTKGKGL